MSVSTRVERELCCYTEMYKLNRGSRLCTSHDRGIWCICVRGVWGYATNSFTL